MRFPNEFLSISPEETKFIFCSTMGFLHLSLPHSFFFRKASIKHFYCNHKTQNPYVVRGGGGGVGSNNFSHQITIQDSKGVRGGEKARKLSSAGGAEHQNQAMLKL